MNITVVAVGRLKEKFWTQAANEYLKRISKYATITVREVADRDCSGGREARALSEEAADILRSIPEGAYVILLDREGMQLTSEGFASKIEDLGISGKSSITCIVGGSLGVDAPIKDRADLRVGFGNETLPHNLARVVLLEQIYRAFKIIRREPYHK